MLLKRFFLEQLERFGKEVMPAFTKQAASVA